MKGGKTYKKEIPFNNIIPEKRKVRSCKYIENFISSNVSKISYIALNSEKQQLNLSLEQIKTACTIRKRKRKGLKPHTIMDCIAKDLSVTIYNEFGPNSMIMPMMLPKEPVSIELNFQDHFVNVAPAYYEHTTNSLPNISSSILNKNLHPEIENSINSNYSLGRILLNPIREQERDLFSRSVSFEGSRFNLPTPLNTSQRQSSSFKKKLPWQLSPEKSEYSKIYWTPLYSPFSLNRYALKPNTSISAFSFDS